MHFYFFSFNRVKCGYLCGLSYYQHNACLISVEKDSRKVNTVEGWGVVVISVVIHLGHSGERSLLRGGIFRAGNWAPGDN